MVSIGSMESFLWVDGVFHRFSFLAGWVLGWVVYISVLIGLMVPEKSQRHI